jgi:5'(3')-deoxyribonucleotidase
MHDGMPDAFREEAIDRIKEKEQVLLNEYGFYIHLVADDSYDSVNAHTHGLFEKYNHLDFQIVLNLHPNIISSIMHNLIDLVKKGERFHDEQEVGSIIQNFNIKLIETFESGRKVLRIILPDQKGDLNKDTMEELYAKQYINHEW